MLDETTETTPADCPAVDRRLPGSHEQLVKQLRVLIEQWEHRLPRLRR